MADDVVALDGNLHRLYGDDIGPGIYGHKVDVRSTVVLRVRGLRVASNEDDPFLAEVVIAGWIFGLIHVARRFEVPASDRIQQWPCDRESAVAGFDQG